MSDPTAPSTALWPNDVLAQGSELNGYRITRILGRGGFGITYLAEDLLGQDFALKEYFPRQFALRQGAQVHAASPEDAPLFNECRDRFVQEARALVSLGHARGFRDDIVRVQTFFEAHGTAYMVMEYVRGRSLQAALRDHSGGMPEIALRALLVDLLAGLATVHNAGLMHRDIKPANILLRDDGRPVLIDFGSSREAGSQQTHGFTQIFSGGYAPPEQILGTRQGPFSDIYAIGTVCYEAIGGKVVDSLARQHAIAAGAPDPMPSATEIGANRYDATLLAAIAAALALDPAARPASAGAMAHLLRPPARDDDTRIDRAPPPPAPPPAKTSNRRAIVVAIVVAIALVVLAAAAAGWLLFGSGSAPPPAVPSAPALATPAPPPPAPTVAVPAPAQPEPSPASPVPQAPAAPPPQVQPEPAPLPHPEPPAPSVPSQIAPTPAPAPMAVPTPTPQPIPAAPRRAAPPPPAPARPPARAPNLNAAHCADIVARVQLGEALSDADRAALRTICKP